MYVTTTPPGLALDRSTLPISASRQPAAGRPDFGTYTFAQDQNGELYIVNGSADRIDCVHDGNPDGCFWAGFRASSRTTSSRTA